MTASGDKYCKRCGCRCGDVVQRVRHELFHERFDDLEDEVNQLRDRVAELLGKAPPS